MLSPLLSPTLGWESRSKRQVWPDLCDTLTQSFLARKNFGKFYVAKTFPVNSGREIGLKHMFEVSERSVTSQNNTAYAY